MAKYLRIAFNGLRTIESSPRNYAQNCFTIRCQLLPEKMKPMAFARPYSAGQSLDQQFAESQKRVTTLSSEPDNDTKLKLYALFKQATVGKCNTKKPGALDFVGKAKWQAWDSLQSMTNEDAKKQYVSTVESLVSSEVPESPQKDSGFQIPGLIVEKKKGYLQITLNRPEKRNAYTTEMYDGIRDILNASRKDDTISFVVFRGKGDFYCSGNDLGNFTKYLSQDMTLPEMAKAAGAVLRDYVSSYIEFPKPLVGIINGPAVGIAVTVLGMFDVVYATDKATFHTPFSALGQSPEACSSYTFPKLMGYAKANQILMLNKKFTANEAKDLGLISEVYPDSSFEQEVEKRLSEMAALPRLSLEYAKQGTRFTEIDTLRKVNVLECELIQERWLSEDCQKAIAAFFSKQKSNL